MNHSFKRILGFIMSAGILASFVSIPTLAHAEMLTRQLEVGSTGSDVSSLQTFLSQDVSLYPSGRVTGYFGDLTKNGVMNFQIRNSIPAVGRVGPVTLIALNSQMAGGQMNSASTQAPTISNLGINANNNTATVSWITNEATKGMVYYSTSPLVIYEYLHSVSVSGNVALTDSNLRNSQNVVIPNLQSNTTYYYMVHTTDQDGNVSVTWPGTFQTNSN